MGGWGEERGGGGGLMVVTKSTSYHLYRVFIYKYFSILLSWSPLLSLCVVKVSDVGVSGPDDSVV